MKRLFFLLMAGLPLMATAQQIAPGIKSAVTFAIVTDSVTYSRIQAEITAYKNAVEAEGLGTYIIARQWKSPEEIRQLLQQLYQRSPKLEGAVLVGDIPIPMVRDAQHLTTAFKMDQRHNWQRSSVPTDRYYDDFDLQFNFLKQDSLRKDYFYYSLSPSSPQYISMDIYTARIKPPVSINGKDKYTLLKTYLQKVVARKKQANKLDNAFFFTGHGYHSQALDAWAGEQLALRDQIPALFQPGGNVRFLNYRMAPAMKFTLLSELQQETLDLAVFHEHGTEEEQIINGYADASNPQPSIENVKRYLRSKIQGVAEKKGDVQKAKESYVTSLGVPMAWMDDALEDSVKRSDSILNASQDIITADIAGIHPNARFVMLDACENGSFHLDDYIAGYYPFGDGHNIVCMANSIGVLQDNWSNEMLGLLQQGVRAGNWLRMTAFPETHLFGDPTFSFTTTEKNTLNSDIVNNTNWQKHLEDKHADTRALALVQLFNKQHKTLSAQLKQIYFNDPAGAVRLEALYLLNRCNNADYHEVLKAAINDPYELVRRLAARMIGDTGSDELAPFLVQLAITNRSNARVMTSVKSALSFMNTSAVLTAIDQQLSQAGFLVDSASVREKLTSDALYTKEKLDRDGLITFDTKATLKERYFNITTLRNYRYHSVVPQVIKLALDKTDKETLRLAAIEALGWFTHSFQRQSILNMCDELLKDSSNEIKQQATRTKQRLLTF